MSMYWKFKIEYFWAKKYSILKFLYIISAAFWCHISNNVIHIWPNEHISGPKALDLELSIHTHWLTLILLQPYMNPFWPSEQISGKLVLDHELSIHTHWLIVMLPQTYMSPCLTYWTYFCQISPRSWTLTPDYISTIEYCIFDLMDKFRDKEYSIWKFQYILIDWLWSYFSHIWTLFWPTEHISGKLVLDDEISIQTHWLFLVLHQTVVHIWPKEHISGPRALDLELSIDTHWLLILFQPYRSPF